VPVFTGTQCIKHLTDAVIKGRKMHMLKDDRCFVPQDKNYSEIGLDKVNKTTIGLPHKEKVSRAGIRTESSGMGIGTAYVVTQSHDSTPKQFIFTPTQMTPRVHLSTPRVQQHNPRRTETSYKPVNVQRAFLQDNNKPAPTRIKLHTTHL
jgi:hypothetical protein